jgi:hypothetical protein
MPIYLRDDGNDANDGSSDALAVATPARVEQLIGGSTTGQIVLAACNDAWSNTNWEVTFGGTSGSPGTIEAYYMSGGSPVIGVSGAKPRFNGIYNPASPPASCGLPDDGVFNVRDYNGQQYVRFRNLDVRFGYRGLNLWRSNQEILNCDISDIYSEGIFWGFGYSNFTLADSTITGTGRYASAHGCGWTVGTGAALMTAGGTVNVQRNRFDQCPMEGVLLQERLASDPPTYLIEDNELALCLSGAIYIASTANVTVRRNLIYSYAKSGWTDFNAGINVAYEDWTNRVPCDNISIYNNLIANKIYGMAWGGDFSTSESYDNNLVYHNTVVECDYAMAIWSSFHSAAMFTNSFFRNNLFQRYTTGVMQWDTNGTQYATATWSNNHFTDTPPAFAQGSGDTSGDALLSKSAGWRAISALGDVTALDFALTVSSPCIDAALDIATYSDEDYLEVARGSSPDIGALEYVGVDGGESHLAASASVQAVSYAIVAAAGSMAASAIAAATSAEVSDVSDVTISCQSVVSGVSVISVTAAALITATLSPNIVPRSVPGSDASLSASSSLTGRGRSRMVDKRMLGNKRAVAP